MLVIYRSFHVKPDKSWVSLLVLYFLSSYLQEDSKYAEVTLLELKT